MCTRVHVATISKRSELLCIGQEFTVLCLDGHFVFVLLKGLLFADLQVTRVFKNKSTFIYAYYVFIHVFVCLQHGACVNAMDLWQFTPLHEAASKNRVEVCSLLLSHGADPTLVNCHGKSAVDMAPTPELKERLTCEHVTLILLFYCCFPSRFVQWKQMTLILFWF